MSTSRPARRLRVVDPDGELPRQGTTAVVPLLLTIEEVAERLRVSRGTAYQLAQRGVIPTVKLPGSRLVRVSAEALARMIRDGVAS